MANPKEPRRRRRGRRVLRETAEEGATWGCAGCLFDGCVIALAVPSVALGVARLMRRP